MPDADRTRWNERYAATTEGDTHAPSEFVTGLAVLVPPGATAIDVAGGAGRHALWLAAHGCDVTLVDISDVALRLAGEEAARRGLELRLVPRDLAALGMPPGLWDLVLCTHYLDRDLVPQMIAAVAPGGLLAMATATVRNLERHARPPRHYVLDEGELVQLVDDLDILSAEERWFGDHHEARVVARRTRRS